MTVRQIDWDRVDRTEPARGVTRQILVTESSTVVRYTYAPGAAFPAHRHADEQVTLVHSGAIEFLCGTERVVLEAGGILVIPAGVPHAATVIGDVEVVTDNYFATAARAPIAYAEGDETV
jgi:quercetin dioxygenase-like cupin family protein